MQFVVIETPHGDMLEGWTDIDADLDGTFTVIEVNGEGKFRVNGWTCYIRPYETVTAAEEAEGYTIQTAKAA
jgi:hypothetical protein